MRLLIKLGGTLLDEESSRRRLAAEIATVAAQHPHTVVVHGGGKQMTRFLTERGVQSQFVNGLRVTTPEVVDAVLKVFAGTVNHELVATLVAAGAQAVGLTGIDAALVEAEQWSPELGAVGKPVRSNPEVLNVLTGAGFLPVVACVAGDRQGNIYNVNADQMAASCAAGFAADRLIFLTDVAGVMDGAKQIVAELTRASSRQLIDSGVASGGMQAKLEAADRAIAEGVGQVCIAPGAETNILSRLLEGETIGTRVVK